MAHYQFTARTQYGKQVHGIIESWSAYSARRKLRGIRGWQVEYVQKESVNTEVLSHQLPPPPAPPYKHTVAAETHTEPDRLTAELERIRALAEDSETLSTEQEVSRAVVQELLRIQAAAAAQNRSLPPAPKPSYGSADSKKIFEQFSAALEEADMPKLPAGATDQKLKLSTKQLPEFKKFLYWFKELFLKLKNTELPSIEEILHAGKLIKSVKGRSIPAGNVSATDEDTEPGKPKRAKLKLAQEESPPGGTIPFAATAPVPEIKRSPARVVPPRPKKPSFWTALSTRFVRKPKQVTQEHRSPWRMSFGSYFRKNKAAQNAARISPLPQQNLTRPPGKPGLFSSLRNSLLGKIIKPEITEEHARVEELQSETKTQSLSREEIDTVKASGEVGHAARQPGEIEAQKKRLLVLEGFKKKTEIVKSGQQKKTGLLGGLREGMMKRRQRREINKFHRLNFRVSKAERDRKRKKEQVIVQGYKKTGNVLLDFFSWINDKLIDLTPISTKDLVTFFNLLAVMVNAGIPLLKALKQLLEHTENARLKKVLYAIVYDIENGSSLSEAMMKFNKVFSDAHIGMVETGEASGQLGDILKQIAKDVEKQHNLISKVRGAMIYPATILCILLIVGVIVMTMIVPKITELFASSNVELPFATKMLIGTSSLIRNYWYILFGALGGLIVGVKAYINTSEGRYYFDYVKIKMPVFGKLLQKLAIARFARSLSTLSQSGLSIIKALHINADSVGNEIYRQEILSTSESVKRGIGIAQDLDGNKLFPPLVVNMIAIGEETAQVGPIAGKIANFYEEEVDDTVKNISSLIEPLIVVVIGVGVGFMVAAIMQPILQISDVATKSV